MSNRTYRIVPVVLLCLLLTACSCKHEWISATCTSPVTCAKCGETAGEPTGHSWIEATCSSPRSCARCGALDGTPLNHDWIAPTCVSPSRCSRCGLNNGSLLGDHVWVDATYERAKHCSVCSLEEGVPKVNPYDIRYVLAACAYRAVLEQAQVPSSTIIERARYTPELEEIGYPTVFLECSVVNSTGGRSLIRCYAYKVVDPEEASEILPRGSYYTYTHLLNTNNGYHIYCQTEMMATDFNEISCFTWEQLNAEAILQRYKDAI